MTTTKGCVGNVEGTEGVIDINCEGKIVDTEEGSNRA